MSFFIYPLRKFDFYGNSKEILFIKNETAYIKSQLGKQTKEWVARKMSTVLAKITTEGPGILKTIFKEFGKQIMTEGVKFLLEHSDKLL